VSIAEYNPKREVKREMKRWRERERGERRVSKFQISILSKKRILDTIEGTQK
jgi:hypothetical protein